MENLWVRISVKIAFMKKKLTLLVMLFVIGTVAGNAQTEKKEPPPPPPPKVDITKFTPPVITMESKNMDEFYKRNPSVTEVSRQGDKMILKLKDSRKEEYNLDKKEENKTFTEKYGKPPIPAPPPPPLPKPKTKA